MFGGLQARTWLGKCMKFPTLQLRIEDVFFGDILVL